MKTLKYLFNKAVIVLITAAIQLLIFYVLMYLTSYIVINIFDINSIRDLHWGISIYYFKMLLPVAFIICDIFALSCKKKYIIAASCVFCAGVLFYWHYAFCYRPYRTIQMVLASFAAYATGIILMHNILNIAKSKRGKHIK